MGWWFTGCMGISIGYAYLLGSPPRWFLRRTAALAGLFARRHHLVRWVAVRRDLDILQADPRWGYDCGVGSLSESPLVAVVVVLGTYTDY